MHRRRGGLRGLIQMYMDRNRGGGRPSNPNRGGSSRDVEMRARNDRMRIAGQPGLSRMMQHPAVQFGQSMSAGVAQPMIDRISRDVYSRLGQSGITRDKSGAWGVGSPLDATIRRAVTGAGSGASGTGTTFVRGRGSATASAEPGTVSIGRISTDNPPTITINGERISPTGVPPIGQPRPIVPKIQPTTQGNPVYSPTVPGAATPRPQTQQPQGQIQQPPRPQVTPGLGGVGPIAPQSAPAGSKPLPVIQGPQRLPVQTQQPQTQQPARPQVTPGLGGVGPIRPQATPGLGGVGPIAPRQQQQQPQQTRVGTMTPEALGQMMGGMATDRGMGNPGPTQVPSNPPRGLSNLGGAIEQAVKSAIAMGGQYQTIPGGMTSGQQIQRPVPGITPQAPTTQPGRPTTQPQTQIPTQPGAGVTPGGTTQPQIQQPPAGQGQQPQGGMTTQPPGQQQPPPVSGGVGSPTGIIDHSVTPMNLPNTNGMDWSQVNQWDSILNAEAAKWGVDPAIVKAVMALESNGVADAANPNSSSFGLLQIQPEWHAAGAAQLGYDLNTPEGQIGYFSALIAGQAPGQNLHGDPLSNAVEIMAGATAGGTPEYEAAYRGDIETLMGIMAGAGGSSAPIIQDTPGQPPVMDKQGSLPGPGTSTSAPTTGGQVVLDTSYQPTGATGMYGGPGNTQPRAVMSPESLGYLETLFPGASQAALNDNYGFGANSGCDGCYNQYYDWDPNAHPGMDINTGGQSGQFNALVSGTVVCYGSQTGANPDPNTGCGSYPDFEGGGVDGSGSGNLSILTQDGAIVTYGHTDVSYAQLGSQVSAGQPLGMSGIMNGYHVHLEVKIPIGPGGSYVLVDPNLYFNGYYCQQGFCPQ